MEDRNYYLIGYSVIVICLSCLIGISIGENQWENETIATLILAFPASVWSFYLTWKGG